jgi:hypothetical protein
MIAWRKAMKKKLPFIIFIISVLFSANIAFAESTQVMLSACRAITKAEMSEGTIKLPQDFRTGMCWGAFAVLQEIIRHMDEPDHHTIYGVCPPANSKRSQLISIFVKYAENNPQRLHEDFFPVAIDSLREAF